MFCKTRLRSFVIEEMIQSFADKETEKIWNGKISKKLPAQIQKRAYQKLRFLHAATEFESLKFPPSNKLHPLERNRKGQWAIWINDQWRICFEWNQGGAAKVEITDYH